MAPILYWLDTYVNVLQRIIAERLVLAPLLLLFVEEAGVPIIVPGDAIIAYTGYRLSLTHGVAGFWEAFVIAQLAVIGGATILFFLARRWGQYLLYKLSAFVFLKPSHLQHAERLFAKYGVLAIIFGRHIPGLRIPVTFFAATSGVRYLTFILSTILSTSLWIVFYLTVGKGLGAVFHKELQRYVGITAVVFVAAVLVVGLLHLIGARRARKGR